MPRFDTFFFYFGFSDITPRFDIFLLIQFQWHCAQIRSLPFLFLVLQHRAKILSLCFDLGSQALLPDSIPSFCFGFSDTVLGFDPFVFFQVLGHRAQIRSVFFFSGSLSSFPDSIPSHLFGFSSIAPKFDPLILFLVL